MYFKLTSNDIQDILFESFIPIESYQENGVTENSYQLKHRLLEAHFSSIWFEGLHVSFGSAVIHQNIELRTETSSPVLEMIFNLEGGQNTVCTFKKGKMNLLPQEHNILYIPPLKEKIKVEQQENQLRQTVKILLTEAYFKRLATHDSPMFSKMCEKIEMGQLASIGKHNLGITPQMKLIISDILTCKREGVYKRLMLESKVLELLMLQVEQFESVDNPKTPLCIKQGDIEKLHAVKAILEQNIGASYTLYGLARQVGLNDFKLKKGFKTLFGTTVFDYLHQLRMNHAKKLLLDSRNSVYEVSDLVGYSYPQHFTAAFKKHFSILPSDLKN